MGSGNTTLSKTKVLEVCATSVGHTSGPHLRGGSYLVRGAFAFLPAVRCVGVGAAPLLGMWVRAAILMLQNSSLGHYAM